MQEKLRALATLDPQLTLFGASQHRYVSTPFNQVDEWEAAYGVTIPEEYRAWLLTIGVGAGPDYGLIIPEPLRIETFPSVMASVTTNDGETFSAETSARPPLGEISDVRRPFLLDRPFFPHAEVALTNPYDGCVQINEIGCGYFHLLVVNGPRRGEVWVDYTAGDGALERVAGSFHEWFDAWLERSLREVLVASIRRAVLPMRAQPWPDIAALALCTRPIADACTAAWLALPADPPAARAHFEAHAQQAQPDDPRGEHGLAILAWIARDAAAMARAVAAAEARNTRYIGHQLELATLRARSAWLTGDRARALALAKEATRIQPWVDRPWLDLAWMGDASAEEDAVKQTWLAIGEATSGLERWNGKNLPLDTKRRVFREALATWGER